MAARIFLARQEEQKKFREVLRSLQAQFGWWRKNLPMVAKLLSAKKESVSTSPHIFLLYGEGGMGKTSLGKRFGEIAKKKFSNCFEVLSLDWEEKKNEFPSLKIGHDAIQPESILETIYQTASKGREGCFKEYQRVGEKLKKIEEKADKEIQVRQGTAQNMLRFYKRVYV
jgi:hypothetical protein